MEKISIVEQYRKIIVLMNMDIEFFEARSIWQGYFFSVAIPLVTPRELLKVAFFQRVWCVFKIPPKNVPNHYLEHNAPKKKMLKIMIWHIFGEIWKTQLTFWKNPTFIASGLLTQPRRF
jgi:hypothetical protein